MNIFNKTFLAISLALAIPLSTQANWFVDLKAQTHKFRKLSMEQIRAKKKTITTSLVLGGTLSYAALKLVDWFYSSWPTQLSNQEMLELHPHLNPGILFAAERGFKEMGDTIFSRKITAVGLSLALTLQLILKAHDRNLFGENNKKI